MARVQIDNLSNHVQAMGNIIVVDIRVAGSGRIKRPDPVCPPDRPMLECSEASILRRQRRGPL